MIFELNTKEDIEAAKIFLDELGGTGKTAEFWISEKPRTNPQNNSFHLWLTQLAQALNDAGYDLGDGVAIKVPVAFTKDNLKEGTVKPMLKALYPEKVSTTQLSTTEIQELYQRLDEIISSRTGVTVPWPDRFSLGDRKAS